jgi:hypothetical protein
MNDEKLMKEAKKRVEAKQSFKIHALTYVMVNAFLVLIYFVTSPCLAKQMMRQYRQSINA